MAVWAYEQTPRHVAPGGPRKRSDGLACTPGRFNGQGQP